MNYTVNIPAYRVLTYIILQLMYQNIGYIIHIVKEINFNVKYLLYNIFNRKIIIIV